MMIPLWKGQVWELVNEHELVVMLLERVITPSGKHGWKTLVLYDTLYPNDIGTVTCWAEADLVDRCDGDGNFERVV